MKKMIMLVICMLSVFIITGCGTTHTEEYVKYEPGTKKIVEEGTRTVEQSAVGLLMEEMKVKDIAWWICGWYFKITCQFTGSDSYFPNFTIKGGKVNSGHISLTQNSAQSMYGCIRAMQMPISVSVSKDGAKIEEKLSDDEKDLLNESLTEAADRRKARAVEVITGDNTP